MYEARLKMKIYAVWTKCQKKWSGEGKKRNDCFVNGSSFYRGIWKWSRSFFDEFETKSFQGQKREEII